MPGIYLRPFTENKERMQKFKELEIHKIFI